jgi:O-succinylbenzoate synthase
MAEVCRQSPIPVALDEELIPLTDEEQAMELLEICRPAYLILKPSLLGGFADSEQWILRAGAVGARWWVTSALESNVGLAAISAWTSTLHNPLPQGLGTGKLYKNNIKSPLFVQSGDLHWDANQSWDWDACCDNL